MGVSNNEMVVVVCKATTIGVIKEWVRTECTLEEGHLFTFMEGLINSHTTTILAPSGSKKGWDTDIMATKLRKRFIKFLESKKYMDGSSSYQWVEVGFGEFGQKILQGNNKNVYNSDEYATGIV